MTIQTMSSQRIIIFICISSLCILLPTLQLVPELNNGVQQSFELGIVTIAESLTLTCRKKASGEPRGGSSLQRYTPQTSSASLAPPSQHLPTQVITPSTYPSIPILPNVIFTSSIAFNNLAFFAALLSVIDGETFSSPRVRFTPLLGDNTDRVSSLPYVDVGEMLVLGMRRGVELFNDRVTL